MERHECIVVGGGIAGLTATVYLARAGFDVLLLEKNERCGGLVNTFVKDGFRFEGGVRALESAGIILPMLEELGVTLETLPNPVSVGIEGRVMTVTSRESLNDYAALLKDSYPDNVADIERVIAMIKRVMKHMEVLYGVSNPLFHDFRSDMSYFVRVYTPWFFKFLNTIRHISRMRGPAEALLDGLVSSRPLRDIISQHFFKNTPAFFAMSYFYLYTDYLYPKGGVGRLAEVVEEKVLDFGGKIKMTTEITGVNAAERWVTDRAGNRYGYEHLIWAADLKTLYRLTETAGLPAGIAGEIEAEKHKLLAARGADSVLTLYAGVDAPPEAFRALSAGHFFYTPSRQGLGEIHRSELRALLDKGAALSKAEVLAWLDRFCALTTYEIAIPALKDLAAAPAGKTGLIISTLFEYDLVKRVYDAGWYEEFKAEVEQRMIETLAGSIYPMLRDQVLFRFSTTPLTIEKQVGSSEGAIIGWSFEAPIPVPSTMLKVNDAAKTRIPHVTVAGQWSYSPMGVPTAILTGRLAPDKLIRARKSK